MWYFLSPSSFFGRVRFYRDRRLWGCIARGAPDRRYEQRWRTSGRAITSYRMIAVAIGFDFMWEIPVRVDRVGLRLAGGGSGCFRIAQRGLGRHGFLFLIAWILNLGRTGFYASGALWSSPAAIQPGEIEIYFAPTAFRRGRTGSYADVRGRFAPRDRDVARIPWEIKGELNAAARYRVHGSFSADLAGQL